VLLLTPPEVGKDAMAIAPGIAARLAATAPTSPPPTRSVAGLRRAHLEGKRQRQKCGPSAGPRGWWSTSLATCPWTPTPRTGTSRSSAAATSAARFVLHSNRGFADWRGVRGPGGGGSLPITVAWCNRRSRQGRLYRMRAICRPTQGGTLLCSAELDRLCAFLAILSAPSVLTHRSGCWLNLPTSAPQRLILDVMGYLYVMGYLRPLDYLQSRIDRVLNKSRTPSRARSTRAELRGQRRERTGQRVVSVRIEQARYERLEQVAANAGVAVNQLVGVWLSERIDHFEAGAILSSTYEELRALGQRLDTTPGSVHGTSIRAPKPRSSRRDQRERPRSEAGRAGRAMPRRKLGLHAEIITVLREYGKPMTAAEIAEVIRARGMYQAPRSGQPITGAVVSRRVSNPNYRSLFERRGREVTLATDSGSD
jgi:predicted DNA-binding ribbon-helix-helix protein